MKKSDANLSVLLLGINALAHHLGSGPASEDEAGKDLFEAFKAELERENSSPLARLVRRYALNDFELKALLLALAPHLEPRWPELTAKATGSDLDVGLALQVFSASPAQRLVNRTAFNGASTLRHARLIQLTAHTGTSAVPLVQRGYELTAPTLRLLLEEDELSDHVGRVARLVEPSVSLLNVILDATHMRRVRELVEQHENYQSLLGAWGFDNVLPYDRGLSLLFSGPSGTGKTLFGHALAAHVKQPLLVVNAAELPRNELFEGLFKDIFAEASVRNAIVLLEDCETVLGREDARKSAALRVIRGFEGITLLVTRHPERLDDMLERRISTHFPFEEPDPRMRRQLWEVHLPPEVPLGDHIDLELLANRYDFNGGTIKNAISVAINRALARSRHDPKLTMEMLDQGCLSQLHYALEDLTVRSSTHHRLSDIVLPDDQAKKVREIIAAIRNQSVVLNQWGFGKKIATGKGITCLFDGPPGTGKTFCAEIVAGEFERPIYRVNLPEVVSKWVGETEKHIRAIFQQARIAHAMLLFDEADSLFAARSSETSNATDRHANMEVNLLLQEIERFPGVCILTTNFFGSLDKALVRRIQFRVTFEEPAAAHRALIWKKLLPPEAPLCDEVDFDALAERFELTGGMIKNSLLRAAYWACDSGKKINQDILSDACLDEYKAAGKVARDPAFEKRRRRPSPASEDDDPDE